MPHRRLAARLALAAWGFAALAFVAPIARLHAQTDDPFQQNVRTTEPLAAEEQLRRFHVPPGFVVELVASEPAIQKPMNLAFDARGRLWVSGSVEYPFAAADGQGRDAIRILTDTDGNGSADRVETFVDGLNIPIGLYPYRDGVIAYSISSTDWFRDTDGDGRSDQRTVLYGPLDQPVDTHGMQNAFRRGLDGWLYVNHGFANRTTIGGRDGSQVALHSGNTYRIRVDGSRVEPFTRGQVNPFGSAWTDSGDLVTADCHSKPLTLLQRDGCYQSFGKPHDGLGFAPELLHHLHGSTGLAGVVYANGDHFPAQYAEGLFVANVVTSRVHHDRLAFEGASPRAIEQPDFLTCDDPWFRPVEMCLGPDGAIYIADFYNRIIGHYEVDIHHPGRDRFRGRIWRVRYVGDQPQPTDPHAEDLSRLALDEQLERLNDANLSRRMLVTDYLADTVGSAVAPRIRTLLAEHAASADRWRQRAHARWLLFRWNELHDDELLAALRDDHPQARRHAQRMVAESATPPDAALRQVRDALKDPDANVQRHAADALGRHPRLANVGPLLDALQHLVDDDYLRHGLRIALRNNLRDDQVFAEVLATDDWTDRQRELVTGVCLGIPTSSSAAWIIETLRQASVGSDADNSPAVVADPATGWDELLRHAARHVPAAHRNSLMELAQIRAGADVDVAIEMFAALAASNGAPASTPIDPFGPLHRWGSQLADQLLQQNVEYDRWRCEQADPPWGLESRMTSEGASDLFLSSLPGGESRTSRLSSAPFALPAALDFDLCGHRGHPEQVAREPRPEDNGQPTAENAAERARDNFVQLRLVSTGQVIRRAFPPRRDQAVRVHWDLTAWQGQQAVLEVVDDQEDTAYAWLAVARFEPSVLTVPAVDPRRLRERRWAAARIIHELRLASHLPTMRQWACAADDPRTRAEAARAVLEQDGNQRWLPLAEMLEDDSLPTARQQSLAESLLEGSEERMREEIRQLFQSLPQAGQHKLARLLASHPSTAGQLLQLIEAGQASGRLLQRPAVRDPLLAGNLPDAKQRVERIVETLPAESEELERLLADAIAGATDDALETTVEAGRAVFDKNCTACHQAAGQGKLVGPQLDGVGTRGLPRVAEDVFAPYRNVDESFRTTVLNLSDGRVLTGLVRERKADEWIVVDATGKPQTIPASLIEESRTSASSIMPDNFGQTLTPADRTALLRYLLSLREQRP